MIDQIDVIAQAQPDYKPSKLYNVPQAGQKVPNFSFLNQDGRTITLDQFRGKVLLLTFIYARCPLPDYCIRMSRNFAAIQQKLAAAPLLDNRVHLLSVSFDPAYDTRRCCAATATSTPGNGAAPPLPIGISPCPLLLSSMRSTASSMWASPPATAAR